MILQETKRDVQTSGNAPVEMLEYGITTRKSRESFFHQAFRDKIYRYKEKAALREYATNAADAHRMISTPDRPIEITLPNDLLNEVRIRDYGPSLDDEGMAIFCTYFESTKDQDAEANGVLGLGSKSAFAIGSSFTVTRYKDGEKTIFQSYIDEDNKNKMVKLPPEPSDEPTGIEISIPTSTERRFAFIEAAKDVYKWFNPLPTITNNPEVAAAIQVWSEREPDWKGSFKDGTHWKLFYKGAKPVVVMANVAYPIEVDKVFGKETAFKKFKTLCSIGLELYANTGDVNFTLSREDLEYDIKTINWIKKRVALVHHHLMDQVAKKAENIENRWEARIFYAGMRKINTLLDDLFKESKPIWKGKELPLQIDLRELKAKDINFTSYQKDNGWRRKKDHALDAFSLSYVEPDPATVFLIVHAGEKKPGTDRLHAKINTYMEWYPDADIVLVTCPTEEAEAELLGHPDFVGAKFIDLLPIQELQKFLPSKLRKYDDPKRKSKVFAYRLGDCPDKKFSDAWEQVEVDLEEDEGVYIRIHSFLPHGEKLFPHSGRFTGYYGYHSNHPLYKLTDFINSMSGIGAYTPRIYGIRHNVKGDKIGARWIHINDWAKVHLKREILANQEAFTRYVQRQELGTFYTGLSRSSIAQQLPDGKLKGFLAALEEKPEGNNYAYKLLSLCQRLSFNYADYLDPKVDLLRMQQEVEESYPMLRVISEEVDRIDDHKNEFLRYVEFVEGCRAVGN